MNGGVRRSLDPCHSACDHLARDGRCFVLSRIARIAHRLWRRVRCGDGMRRSLDHVRQLVREARLAVGARRLGLALRERNVFSDRECVRASVSCQSIGCGVIVDTDVGEVECEARREERLRLVIQGPASRKKRTRRDRPRSGVAIHGRTRLAGAPRHLLRTLTHRIDAVVSPTRSCGVAPVPEDRSREADRARKARAQAKFCERFPVRPHMARAPHSAVAAATQGSGELPCVPGASLPGSLLRRPPRSPHRRS